MTTFAFTATLTSPRWAEFLAREQNNSGALWPPIDIGSIENITLKAWPRHGAGLETFHMKLLLPAGFEALSGEASYDGELPPEGHALTLSVRAVEVGEWWVGGIATQLENLTSPNHHIVFTVTQPDAHQ